MITKKENKYFDKNKDKDVIVTTEILYKKAENMAFHLFENVCSKISENVNDSEDSLKDLAAKIDIILDALGLSDDDDEENTEEKDDDTVTVKQDEEEKEEDKIFFGNYDNNDEVTVEKKDEEITEEEK